MTKLNQLLAVSKTAKANADAQITAAYHAAQKPQLMSGLQRTYRPVNDDDKELLPPESQLVQTTVTKLNAQVAAAFKRMFDVVATIDATNCVAKADVRVGKEVILAAVPATHLLFLEKQLVHLHTFISKLPTLDPAFEWVWDAENGYWKTLPTETHRSRKVMEVITLAQATEKHPAQAQIVQKDELAGYWTTLKLSGAIPPAERDKLLGRVADLQEAVKAAREEANMVDVVNSATSKILDYVFLA